ncbi:pyruvate kinase-like [Rhagoletis pomonella]|uniref:pyruvate kinase-like n=1 Tax=Rhagoletis pomonella TaxID=28610 RepID=UPI001786741F|nr:pyruvate kinase-like [Rhagoletis pomonella]
MSISNDSETLLEHMCQLQIDGPTVGRRLTNIICTIGHATRDKEILKELIKGGMNIARLNFSHESHEQHKSSIDLVREASALVSEEEGYRRHIGIAVDTKGPEIRTGSFEGFFEVELKKNDNIRLSINKDLIDKGSKETVYVDYPNIINIVQPGNIIYLSDGAIMLLVKEVAVDCVICQVEVGGILGAAKGVWLSRVNIDLPPVSEKDRYDLRFAVEHNIDFIFASKIRHPAAIREIRAVLGERGKDIQIISKIDCAQILNYLDEVILASDGILIDRSSLGIEVRDEKLFLLQKAIIARCNRVGKPVIVGTQILSSMNTESRPTRSDVADLGNVVLDGVDGVMIASESAIGKYPLETLNRLASICAEAEAVIWHRHLHHELLLNNPAVIDAVHAVALAAIDSAQRSMAALIVCLTTSGRSAYMLSMYRPHCAIIALTRCSRTARQCHLRRGVYPVLYLEKPDPDYQKDVDLRVQYALVAAKKAKLVDKGDSVVIVSPWKEGTGFANNLRIAYAFFESQKIEYLAKRINANVKSKTTIYRES